MRERLSKFVLTAESRSYASLAVLAVPDQESLETLNRLLKLKLPPLKLAVIRGDAPAVRRAFQSMSDEEKRKQIAGSETLDPSPSLLRLAARHGHVDVIKELVKLGADVNDNANPYRKTPLANAAEAGHVPAVEALIRAGADVNLTTDYTALMRACVGQKPKTAKLLLERGADPNAARRNGERALHLAAEHRAIECVLVLLDHGADPSALAYRRDTALTLARRRDAQQRHRGREEIARILRAAVDTKAGKPR